MLEPARASVPSAAFRAAAAAVPGLNSWRGALRLAMGLFALSMLNTQIHGPGNSVSVGAYRWVNAGFLVRLAPHNLGVPSEAQGPVEGRSAT